MTLTRLQSGVGTLTIEAACSDEVGDLRLGAAFQLSGGQSSTVQFTGGARFAPAGAQRPLLVAGRDRFERIAVDLRQSRSLERLAVYAFSESGTSLRWGGTLLLTTLAGATVEVPLETLEPGRVAVVATVYNVAGEFVLRRELLRVETSIRDACRAFGYDRITWLDEHRPVQ